jgi:hypothetical protein
MSDGGDYVDGNKRVGRNGVAWRFTDKEFTPWGGLRVFEEMLTGLGWEQALALAAWPQPGSNRGIDPALMIKAFLVTVWIGGGRFAHTAMVRFDQALRAIFGLKQVASTSTFSRFFRRFDRKQVEEVFAHLSQWTWQRLEQSASGGGGAPQAGRSSGGKNVVGSARIYLLSLCDQSEFARLASAPALPGPG